MKLKRFLSLAMASALLTLTMSTGVTAWAELQESAKGTITLKLLESKTNAAVKLDYEIEWPSDMTYTYTRNVVRTWNPSAHVYDDLDKGGSWDKTTGTVTITNHGETDIDVTTSLGTYYVPGVTVSLDALNRECITCAIGEEYEDAWSASSKWTISGAPLRKEQGGNLEAGKTTSVAVNILIVES